MSWFLNFAPDALVRAVAPTMRLRPDMAEAFQAEAGRVPPGPKWILTAGTEVVAVGGLEPAGAGASLGWLLVSDLDRRGWVMVRKALTSGVEWAGRHAIRRVHALVANDQPKHAALLSRLGFKLTGQQGDNAVMTLEMEKR